MPAPPTSGGLIQISNTVDDQGVPHVAALPDGNVAVVFRNLGNADVSTRVIDAFGGGGGFSTVASGSGLPFQNSTSLAVLADGRFIVAYADGDSGDIFLRQYGRNGDFFGTAIQITLPGVQKTPAVVGIPTTGGFAAAYGDENPNPDAVMGQGFSTSGTVIDSTIFYGHTSNSTADSRPAIAAFDDGAQAVAYYTSANDLRMTYVSEDFSSYETSEITVATGVTTFTDLSPHLAVLADGNLLVAWNGPNSSNQVRARIYDRQGQPLTGTIEIAASGLLSGVTALAGGGFMVVYSSVALDDVNGRIYDADYQATSAAFTLMDGVGAGSVERSADVAQLSDGRIIVVASVPNGSEEDIVGQIYDPRTAGLNAGASSFDDNWVGTVFADRVYMGASADDFRGGDGNDTAYGEAGNDKLHGDAGGDKLYGGDGGDTLRGGIDNDTLNGELGNDMLYGDAGSDTISGGDGLDTLDGWSEGDILSGNNGNDTINGGSGQDAAYGGNGNDTIDGGFDKDTLNGDANNDILFGSFDGDTLRGGTGNDRLNGGLGNDVHVGGAGSDVFVFTDYTEGNDRIDDWVAADDQIEIDASTFGGGLAAGALAANRLVVSAAPVTNQAFGQFLYNTTSGQLSWDADGTGAGAAVAITRLLNGGVAVATLAVGDFDIVA